MKKGQNKKQYKAAPHPTVIRLVKTTVGGRHGIYEVELDSANFLVRKPLGTKTSN
jgi:hypothetical protein